MSQNLPRRKQQAFDAVCWAGFFVIEGLALYGWKKVLDRAFHV